MYPQDIFLQQYINYNPSQGTIDCCTASAILLAAEIIMATANIKINFSRIYLYYMTRKLQGRLALKGAELRETLKALSIYGVVLENIWPLRSHLVNRPPSLAVENSIHYKLNSFEEIIPDQYKMYLNQNIPIIIGMTTGKKFWSLHGPLNEQLYKPVNNTDNRQSNGHAIVCIGYDDNLNGGSWIIANSSGPDWGYFGYAAIPYECNIDFGESYVITNFAGITAGKKISEIDK